MCVFVCLSPPHAIFKASALWANAFYKLKCPSVCLSVRVCVCSLLRYRFNVFLPPLPKVGCPIFLEIRNPWGKVIERSGLRFEHFCLKIVKNRRAKKSFFCWFCLTKHGGNHASRWIRDLWSKGISLFFGISVNVFEFLQFGWFFPFFKKKWFLGILGPSGNNASRWIRVLWSKGVLLISRRFWVYAFWMIFSVFQKNQVLGYSLSNKTWWKPRIRMD